MLRIGTLINADINAELHRNFPRLSASGCEATANLRLSACQCEALTRATCMPYPRRQRSSWARIKLSKIKFLRSNSKKPCVIRFSPHFASCGEPLFNFQSSSLFLLPLYPFQKPCPDSVSFTYTPSILKDALVAATYFLGKIQYHRPWSISLLCSVWEQVGQLQYSRHQNVLLPRFARKSEILNSKFETQGIYSYLIV